jgi:hypothetical protein
VAPAPMRPSPAPSSALLPTEVGSPVTPSLGVAARTLALDLATGEVVRALNAAGVAHMLLKGPTMVDRLYGDAAPGTRNYGDIDLLVAPANFEAAGQVLAGLGFRDRRAGIRRREAARLQERPWHRDGLAYIAVDLHRGFHNVTDWDRWWDLLSQQSDVLMVEGQAVVVPNRVGCALVAGLHASKASTSAKPVEDLRRALDHFDDEIWREAAVLAGLVGADEAFAAALGRVPAGQELAIRLGLVATDRVLWFEARSTAHGAGAMALMLAPGSRRDRAWRALDVLLPSRVMLAESRPLATRGMVGLLAAYLWRLARITTRLPGLAISWHRTNGSLRHRRHPGSSRRL